MKIINVKPGSPEWLEERRSRICASDTPKILGYSRWGDALDVCIEKWGEQESKAPSSAMVRGLDLENAVALAYSKRKGIELEPGFFAEHSDYPWMAATPDRKIKGNGGLVQIKTHLHWLSDEYGPDGSNVYPEAELVQVLHEIEVAGAEYADLVPVFGSDQVFDMLVYLLKTGKIDDEEASIYMLEKMDLRVFRIERDDDLQEAIIEADKEFFEKYVLPHEIPPDAPTFQNKDSIRKATDEEIKIIQALKARWIEQRRAEEALEDIKARAKKAIGEDKGIDAGSGEKITFSKNKDTTEEVINWEKIAKHFKVPEEIVHQASETVVNWEKAVKMSPTIAGIPSELWDKIIADHTEVNVTRKGVRTFRVPHQKWAKEII